MRKLTMLLAAIFLASCQALVERSEDSPAYAVPAGSVLTLNRALEIPPGRAGVHLQHGRVLEHGGAGRYEPYCRFEVKSIEGVRRIEAHEMVVRRVEREGRMVLGPTAPVQVAGLRFGFGIGLAFDIGGGTTDAGPTTMINRTLLYLDSPDPDVHLLRCEYWDNIAHSRHLTIREIRTALGEVFTLRLPD